MSIITGKVSIKQYHSFEELDKMPKGKLEMLKSASGAMFNQGFNSDILYKDSCRCNLISVQARIGSICHPQSSESTKTV